jgi:5-methylcytosine-specific restriction endonuclease McrA
MTSRRPDHIPARKAFPPKVRQAIYDRSGGECEACGVEIAPDNWHCDHVIPVAFGGESTLANGQALCQPCNTAKGKLEAKMALRADKMGGRIGQQKRRAEGKTAKIPGRGFDKRYKRRMDGSVVRRDDA